MSQTTEAAFESCVSDLLTAAGLQSGSLTEWDKARTLFPARVFAFIEATQKKLWTEMAALHGGNLQAMLLMRWSRSWTSRAACMCCATASSSTASCSGWPTSSRRTRCRLTCWPCMGRTN